MILFIDDCYLNRLNYDIQQFSLVDNSRESDLFLENANEHIDAISEAFYRETFPLLRFRCEIRCR